MIRTLKLLILAVTLNAFSVAAPVPSTITGQVRSTDGVPQMGAAVQLFSSASERVVTAFTDEKGRYSTTVPPGTYQLKVTAPSYLPSLRENVAVVSGAHIVIDLTVNTLSEALQFIPMKAQKPSQPDDWKWTLRSAANRPILRILEDSPLVVVSKANNPEERTVKARVAFMAGADTAANAAGDVSTTFNVEEMLSASSTLTFNGNVSYGTGDPSGTVQATYHRDLADGSKPQFTLRLQRFANLLDSAASSLGIKFEDDGSIAEFAELHYGVEASSVQFRGSSIDLHPFAAIKTNLGSHAVLEYRFATTRPQAGWFDPNDERIQRFADLPSGFSLRNGLPSLERARHHELSFTVHRGVNTLQVAAFSDELRNTALMGIAEAPGPFTDLLTDVDSGNFAYNAGDFSGQGVRMEYERELPHLARLAFDYSFGPTLEMDSVALRSLSATMFHAMYGHSVTAKFAGKLPVSGTLLAASYKWSTDNALLPIDSFNSTRSQADPYLSMSLRQPIPPKMFLPKGMEALVDIRNLLAEGYRPVIGGDGHTMYLVQTPRTMRGGLAFTF